jgi:hypothetical protein
MTLELWLRKEKLDNKNHDLPSRLHAVRNTITQQIHQESDLYHVAMFNTNLQNEDTNNLPGRWQSADHTFLTVL